MGYRPKYLKLYEIVPPELYKKYRHKPHLLWALFDDRLLWTADQLRKRFGPITVNNWKQGGKLKNRGYRLFNTPVGAVFSQHKFGRALDCNFKNATAQEVRVDIKENPNRPQYLYITCIEDLVDWLHYDVRNWERQKNGILIVKP